MSRIPEFAPKGPELIYAAMADHVEARIRAGELSAGSRLPSERDLAAEYGVGYMTARRAAQELRERGLIVTVQGKGTFVVDPVPKPADGSTPER
jgi:GntR family transcriptional regulator